MKSITVLENLNNQIVLLRLDLNVPIKNKIIMDDTRIILCLPFIKKLIEKKAKIINADLTLICEKPKISPFKEQMVRCVADLLHVEPSQVNVKATTTEGLGSMGRKEGIAANAIVSIKIPTS